MLKKNVVSVKELSGELGLSQGTVSIVLNGRGDEMRISKSTQERVLTAARNRGYQPNLHAKRLHKGKNGQHVPLVSLFCPYMHGSEPIGRVLSGIQHAILFKETNVEVMVQPFEYDKLQERSHMLSNRMCSGAIILSIGETDRIFLQNTSFNIPIVVLNSIDDKYSSVSVDNYEAGNKIAMLFEARGHKTTGFIMPSSLRKPSRLRQLGFTDGCRRLGITLAPNHIQTAELSFDGGFKAAISMLEHRPLPTSLFIGISDMAIGALQAFQKANVNIPDDIEIMTYGDNPLESFVSPSLSTVHLPLEEMSCSCLEMVLKMIHTGDWNSVSQIYPLNLVIRDSCGGFPE